MESLFKKRQDRLNVFHSIRRKNSVSLRKEIPDNVMKSCEGCHESIPYLELVKNQYVCPECGYHFKISCRERLRQWVDYDSFYEMDKDVESTNEDHFEGYDEKLESYKSKTGLHEAVICGIGKIHQQKVALAIMDSNFMMGSMGAVVGDKITRLIEYADKKSYPLIISCTSGGARMQEGIVSLMQMAKTSAALKRFSDHGNLYISVLTHPTTGGVSASFAMLGDIILAEPNALIGFAGKRVIEKTINEVLDDHFQHAEFVLEKGFIDAIVKRNQLRDTLSALIKFHGGKS